MNDNLYPKLLISGSHNVFNEGWNGCGVYMCSGLYQSETFKSPIYIGSSINLQDRIEDEHILSLNRNKHPHNPPLQHAWNKHSEKEGFVWWLLDICEPERTLDVEQKYLDLYRPFVDEFNGFNISHNAINPVLMGENNGFYGKKHTEETRKKMRENHVDNSGENNYWYKRKKPPELVKKCAEGLKKAYEEGRAVSWNKGKTNWMSEESKQNMISKKRGISVSPESEFKKGQTPWNKGKSHPEETKAKISQQLKNSSKCKEAARLKRKKVICVETGVIYESITDAVQKTGFSNISGALNGRLKKCGGFHWKFVEGN